MDWNDPVARLNLIDSVGVERYNAMMEAQIRKSVVETVNGYEIRIVGSRWGRLYFITDLNVGYLKLEQARARATKAPRQVGA